MKIQPLSLCLIVALCVAPAHSQKNITQPPGKLGITVLDPPMGPHAPSVDLAKVHQEAIWFSLPSLSQQKLTR